MFASADLVAGMRWRGRPLRTLQISLLCALLLLLSPATSAEESAAEPAAAETEEEDETKKLLSQLTIVMGGDVVDAQTFTVRDTAKAGKKVMRLGNTRLPEQGDLSDEQYAAKVEAGKAALEKVIGKQMVWHKEAPVEQSDASTVLVDAWSIDGRHINSMMKSEGHLAHQEEYTSELAKDILSVAAEKSKQESYKELEQALKESQKAEREERKKARAKAAEEAQAEEESEPIGLAGWCGIAMLGVIVLGALTNFGKGSNKKVNLNRKRGMFEQFWMKLKGS